MKKNKIGNELENLLKGYNESESPEEYINSIREEGKQGKRKISQRKSIEKSEGIFRLQGVIFTVLGSLVIGGMLHQTSKEIFTYKENNRHITLEEAIKNGSTYEDLGITEEIAQEISDIKDEIKYMDQDNLDEKELRKIADRLEDVQMYVIKSKVAKSLNENKDENSEEITVKDLKLNPATKDTSACIINTANNKTERYDSDFLSSEISSDIADEIDILGKVQGVISGNIDSSKKQYQILKNAVNSIDEYAGAEVIIDKKGKIKVEFTKEKDLGKDNSEEEER